MPRFYHENGYVVVDALCEACLPRRARARTRRRATSVLATAHGQVCTVLRTRAGCKDCVTPMKLRSVFGFHGHALCATPTHPPRSPHKTTPDYARRAVTGLHADIRTAPTHTYAAGSAILGASWYEMRASRNSIRVTCGNPSTKKGRAWLWMPQRDLAYLNKVCDGIHAERGTEIDVPGQGPLASPPQHAQCARPLPLSCPER